MNRDSMLILSLALNLSLVAVAVGCGGDTAAAGAGGDQGGDQTFACSLRAPCSDAAHVTCVMVQCFDDDGNPPPAEWSPDPSCETASHVAAAAACGVQRCCVKLGGVL